MSSKSQPQQFDGKSNAIAIVGAGCRLPGGIEQPADFWNLLIENRDGVGPLPADRQYLGRFLDSENLLKGEPDGLQGGFITDLAYFDPHYFGITIEEAKVMDPQHLLLLETTERALRSVGLKRNSGRSDGSSRSDKSDKSTGVAENRIGLFIGMGSDWIAPERSGKHLHSYQAKGANFCAGRIAQHFDFKGPIVALDGESTCALTGLHLATQAIRNGDCDVALVGAAQTLFDPWEFVNYAKPGLLAGDGRCKAFQNTADGIGLGEGCILLVLQRTVDALREERDIWCQVGSTALSHTGSSVSLAVPHGGSQHSLIHAALKESRIEPGAIQFVEADGSGTTMGDFVEISTLGKVFSSKEFVQPLLVGSIKTNLGYLGAAAGAASLLKMALSIRHRKIPPNRYTDQPSERINWEFFPLEIPNSVLDWPQADQKAIGGVSAFGLNGTLAHTILMEASKHAKSESLTSLDLPFNRIRVIPSDPYSSHLDSTVPGLLQASQKEHPLLGLEFSSPLPQQVFVSQLHKSTHELFYGMRWNDQQVLPSSFALEVGMEMVQKRTDVIELQNIQFGPVVLLDDHKVMNLQSIITPNSTSGFFGVLYGKDQLEASAPWQLIASFEFDKKVPSSEDAFGIDPEELKIDGSIFSGADFYNLLNESGYRYDEAFQVFDQVNFGDNRIVALISTVKYVSHNYVVHPRFLQSGAQLLLAEIARRKYGLERGNETLTDLTNGPNGGKGSEVRKKGDVKTKTEKDLHYSLQQIEKIQFFGVSLDSIWLDVRIKSAGSDELAADLMYYDQQGNMLARFSKCMMNGRELAAQNTLADYQDLWSLLANTPTAHRPQVMQQFIQNVAVNVLDLPENTRVDPEKTFREYGFDSLSTSQFLEQLNRELGIELTQSFYLDYPDLPSLSAHVLSLPVVKTEIDRLNDRNTPTSDHDKNDLWKVQSDMSAVEQMNAMEQTILKNDKVTKLDKKPKQGFWTRLFDHIGRAED